MVEGVETKTEIAAVALTLQSGVEPSGDRRAGFIEVIGNVACSEAVSVPEPAWQVRSEPRGSWRSEGDTQHRVAFVHELVVRMP